MPERLQIDHFVIVGQRLQRFDRFGTANSASGTGIARMMVQNGGTVLTGRARCAVARPLPLGAVGSTYQTQDKVAASAPGHICLQDSYPILTYIATLLALTMVCGGMASALSAMCQWCRTGQYSRKKDDTRHISHPVHGKEHGHRQSCLAPVRTQNDSSDMVGMSRQPTQCKRESGDAANP